MKTQFILLLSILSTSLVKAQQGYSSGTMGMLQSERQYGAYVEDKELTAEQQAAQKKAYQQYALKGLLPQQIVPAEILNYHHHMIALPSGNSKVSLVPELTEHPLEQGHYLMQLGIATATELPADRKPIGVMYILDISGSMSDGKLEQAKKAMIASLDKMYPTDYFGIVLFDDQSEVLIPYGEFASRKADVIKKIEQLATSGGTNIPSGLDLGIQQMMTGAFPDHAKSILLLTDGNTNVGNSSKDQMVAKYKEMSGNSIRISTLGIGIDLRQDLLRDLTAATNGQFHFIERYEDIQKTCVNEFASLTSPIGKDVTLSVQLPAGFELKKVYGASEWVMKEGNLQVNLDDINYYLTQVILLDLELTQDVKVSSTQLSATLSYADYMSGSVEQVVSNTTMLTPESGALYLDMMKNFLIADWAKELKDISDAYHAKPDEEALKQKVGELLSYPLVGLESIQKDEDVLRLKTIFEKVSLVVA